MVIGALGTTEGLKTIGVGAFGECTSLTEIDLPESLETICNLAFADSAVSGVRIPAGVHIGYGAFASVSGAGFTEFTVSSENGLYETVGGILYEKAFDAFDNPIPGEYSELVSVPSGISGSVVIPDEVVLLHNYAFAHCKSITQVIVPAGVKKIREDVFFDAKIEELVVSEHCELPEDCSFAASITYY